METQLVTLLVRPLVTLHNTVKAQRKMTILRKLVESNLKKKSICALKCFIEQAVKQR